MASFRDPQELPVWRTNVPPTVIVVGVVGIHDWVLHACLCRAAEATDVRDVLHVGVLLDLTGMMAPIARTRYAMPAVARVMSRLTAMSLRLPCSLRNTKGTYRMM